MQHSLLNLLRSALIPELGSDISTRSAGYIHLVLITIAAAWTLPYELAVFISYDLDLTGVPHT